MASNQSNALAELAQTLCGVVLDEVCYSTEGEFVDDMNAIKKAQRIIAELAKVVDCKHPDKFMPLDKPYEDITIFSPVFNGLYEQNCFDEDESRFILDLANAAWMCREIAEEGSK